MTCFWMSIAPMAPATATAMMATAGGSPDAICVHTRWATRTPMPAPTSDTPTNQANTITTEPSRPPIPAATSMPVVLVTPTMELATIAPMMKP